MRLALVSLVLAATISFCYGDCYLSNPRGSNNRLNEKRATRQTNNRMFDSQNNARGGYNIGDKTDKAAGNNAANQYLMSYFMSARSANDVTELLIEWTNQHGCGGDEDTNPSKLNCDVVIQYMDVKNSTDTDDRRKLRDGTSTNRQDYTNIPGEQNKDGVRKFTETQKNYNNRKNGNVKTDRGYHEPHEWYDSCRARYRNNGLFTADQNVQQNRATHTRQNANGNRNGYECPEERDYWPYWHPSPWKDIAVLTKDDKNCDFYKSESFNTKPKYECVEKWPNSNNHRHYSSANTKETCDELEGKWTAFYNFLEIIKKTEATCKGEYQGKKLMWAIPYRLGNVNNRLEKACLVLLDEPDCQAAPFSRHNHLGNGADLKALRYKWNLPYIPSGEDRKFVVRIRYNISTDDYDPKNTDSSFNDAPQEGRSSPVTGNPYVDIGAPGNTALQLAINTAQFGRTFQDRTHVSYLVKRPNEIKGKVHNLNVRGKRGNIVQTFPAVEYDFIPNDLVVKRTENVHIQWTGSNTHNNGNPGGDGQTGDDGQGTGGTDRSNIVALHKKDDNFPIAMESEKNFCHNMEVVWQESTGKANNQMQWYDISLKLGSAGYYDCKTDCPHSLDARTQMNNLLNNAPASFSGMVVKFKKAGEHNYMSTRNNAFTNRSQKGKITVK